MLFPTGHFSSEQVADHQPVSLAAMEGLFKSEKQAGIVLVGQPDIANRSIENPIVVPRAQLPRLPELERPGEGS